MTDLTESLTSDDTLFLTAQNERNYHRLRMGLLQGIAAAVVTAVFAGALVPMKMTPYNIWSNVVGWIFWGIGIPFFATRLARRPFGEPVLGRAIAARMKRLKAVTARVETLPASTAEEHESVTPPVPEALLAAFARGAFFHVDLVAESSFVFRDGTFSIKVLLFNNAGALRPTWVGPIAAKTLTVASQRVSPGATDFVIVAPDAIGEPWGSGPIYAVASGKLSMPLGNALTASVHLGGLTVTPKNARGELEAPVQLRSPEGSLPVSEVNAPLSVLVDTPQMAGAGQTEPTAKQMASVKPLFDEAKLDLVVGWVGGHGNVTNYRMAVFAQELGGRLLRGEDEEYLKRAGSVLDLEVTFQEGERFTVRKREPRPVLTKTQA